MARSAKPPFVGSNPIRASMKQSYFIKTFGCQSNKSDSERIAGDYEARGYVEADSWKNCDELVINTCAIRQRAEHRARAFIHNVVQHYQLAKQPRPKIIFTGCMLHHGKNKIMEMIPVIDEILPVNEVGFNQAAIRRDKKHAWVPISAGCNSFCTYCIVPYSRGREQSRSLDEIMAEVKDLVDQGYTEITLLGQNVNSWGLEKVGIGLRKLFMSGKPITREMLPSNTSQYFKPKGTPPFVKLLRKISQFDQLKTIRFISANPWDFHDELIDEIINNQKIDRYVHLPIQSGSNSVLHRMNRGYKKVDYLRIAKKLKAGDPSIVLGTDIIVGFPGETEDEFQETVDVVESTQWKVGFVAMYSPRPGTAADRLYEDDIPHVIKKRRWEILDEIINKNNLHRRPKVV
ncbi:MAG: (Dimethylallyl)adenosine tRNA methylthiotransferase MiaB [Candidatus Pacebacteria bacterium GW2011_GWB1_47_8]|nr:MAG: (Dimethylallyl)adenosine tRNA methylthiotransferase MiaB [Candidatus Pacebacteria bacterium GW2011_GWA1_46_10]KKU84538.1 MAG: (Dimethylallyl)adenosine tRNA methylthiotransferase MiaB [Candidatus Pacebacteria bacterium GW2011_GWB1_47_8]